MDEITSLFLAARDGDRSALADAVRATQAEVWRMAAQLVSRDEADDVTQDTFVRAWRALPAYRGDASARTWLLSIARRACADAVRRRTRHRRLSERLARRAAPEAPGEDDIAGTHSVHALIARLDDGQRTAFVLTQVIGCSYAETAAICGVAVGTIRSRVARARERLVDGLRTAETG